MKLNLQSFESTLVFFNQVCWASSSINMSPILWTQAQARSASSPCYITPDVGRSSSFKIESLKSIFVVSYFFIVAQILYFKSSFQISSTTQISGTDLRCGFHWISDSSSHLDWFSSQSTSAWTLFFSETRSCWRNKKISRKNNLFSKTNVLIDLSKSLMSFDEKLVFFSGYLISV